MIDLFLVSFIDEIVNNNIVKNHQQQKGRERKHNIYNICHLYIIREKNNELIFQLNSSTLNVNKVTRRPLL